jgi:hypothetical protein
VPIRHNIAILAAVAAMAFMGPVRPAPVSAAEPATQFVGPTRILFVDADSVLWQRSAEWNSAYVRNQEKVLLHSLRMKYWRNHLPSDMRMVFDALGYPVSRVIHTPVGHVEEWWTYKLLDPPLRFRDGELLDTDRFEALRSR